MKSLNKLETTDQTTENAILWRIRAIKAIDNYLIANSNLVLKKDPLNAEPWWQCKDAVYTWKVMLRKGRILSQDILDRGRKIGIDW